MAVFLAGLAIGTWAASALAREFNPRAALGWCQLLAAAGIAWTAFAIAEQIPFWPINPSISSDPSYTFQLDLVRCFYVVLPGAILWGASFPVALAAASGGATDPGRTVGRVYAANTLGAIGGSLLTGLVFVPWIPEMRARRALVEARAAVSEAVSDVAS